MAQRVLRGTEERGAPRAAGRARLVGHFAGGAGRSAFTRPRELRAEARAAPAAGRELTFSEAGAGVYTTVPLPANNAGRGSEAAVEVAERQKHRCRRRRLRRRAGGVGGGGRFIRSLAKSEG